MSRLQATLAAFLPRALLDLISLRGYARGRDLTDLLDRLLTGTD